MPEECRQGRAEAKRMAKSENRWQHFRRRMQSSSIRRAARALLVCSSCLCAGCGATGLAWVGEAQLETEQQQSVSAAHVSSSRSVISGSIPATAEQNSTESRPRLQHTVTLGAIDAAARDDAGVQTQPASSLSIHNYNYNQVNVGAPAFGFGSFGYWRGLPDFSPGRVPRPSPNSPQPGQNWPALADHGPSFPYGSLPASPWTRTQ